MKIKPFIFIISFLFIIPGCTLIKSLETPQTLDLTFTQVNKYAELSNASYKDDDYIQDIANKYNLTLVKTKINTDKDVNYFIVKNDSHYIISSRGTASLSDTITDLKFKLASNNPLSINLHTGFDQAAQIIANEVKSIIPKDAIIETTGHSLGGAMAVAVAFYLTSDGYHVSRVVTFGQPRVTDYLGAKKYSHIPITRYVAEKDVVPMMPPILADVKSGGIYWHVGNEVVLGTNGIYQSLNNNQSMKRAIQSSVKNFITERDISAHKMDNYLTLIEQTIALTKE